MTILATILEAKRRRLQAAVAVTDVAALVERAKAESAESTPHRLRKALQNQTGSNIIAEFKRASPSKGLLNQTAGPAAFARSYQEGGACAVSVLTEEDHFLGSLDDLLQVREAIDIPVLRKDFLLDEFQVYEAAAAGADAVLLIVAILSDGQLFELRRLAEEELCIDALVEVHTLDEMQRARAAGAKLIGVNNRDLNSFGVSLDVSRELIKHAQSDEILVSESGLKTLEDILELRRLGYCGFLIGETLMRSPEPVNELKRLVN
ncbi:MAG TPA: indole-3-glycerol phosphate synthase TrpC [Pyrinomonadaceae bacterium]|nr:indole-3-glycerol phosphate synthase TrpC [Pyrinomonadaceae bacterium]